MFIDIENLVVVVKNIFNPVSHGVDFKIILLILHAEKNLCLWFSELAGTSLFYQPEGL